MAVPTPPPTTTTVPNLLISEGLPKGPTTSANTSPGRRACIRCVVLPTACTTMLIVPPAGSEFSIVSGMRSPCSLTRTMTNWPGFCSRAIREASITKRLIPGARRSEEHTSELQSQSNLVCRLLLEKKNKIKLVAAERVRLPGESTDRCHCAAGGGICLACQQHRDNSLYTTAQCLAEGTATYHSAGF